MAQFDHIFANSNTTLDKPFYNNKIYLLVLFKIWEFTGSPILEVNTILNEPSQNAGNLLHTQNTFTKLMQRLNALAEMFGIQVQHGQNYGKVTVNRSNWEELEKENNNLGSNIINNSFCVFTPFIYICFIFFCRYNII